MNLLEKIKKDTNYSSDFVYKEIKLKSHTINLIYNEVLSSSDDINQFILKNIAYLIDNEINIDDPYSFFYNSFPSHNVVKIKDYNDVLDKLLNGFVIFNFNNDNFAMEFKASLDRGISEVQNEISIRGPKDAFNENFNKNLGLIKRRIKSKDLWLETLNIGELTKTKVGILYMSNIADNEKLKEIKSKLNEINIDGIIDSGYIKNKLFENSKLFPTVQTTERPDLVCMALLEGKFIILVDTTPYAIIVPSFFIDFFHTPDDYYQKSTNISFIRIIRLIAFFMAIFLPAYYIAITTHNPDSISIDMLLNFINQRKNVPFPSLVEALLMTVSFEILRESDMRMTSTIGSAISILGGLVLGDALVSAGIISPIMIIVVAASSISGFVFTSIELTNAIRFYRILLLILASIFGIFGIYIGLIILIINLTSIKIMGYDYTSTISPLDKEEQMDGFIRISKKGPLKRNPLIAKKNIKRGEDV